MSYTILACAGLDKPLGSLAREVAIRLAEATGSELICPVLLTAVPTRYAAAFGERPVLVIDGCGTRCASKLAMMPGRKIDRKIMLADLVKDLGLPMDTGLTLGPQGIALATAIVDRLLTDFTTATKVTASETWDPVAAYLTVTHDKYQFRIPQSEYLFNENDVWVRVYGTRARVGVSDYVQQKLTDLTYYAPANVGDTVEQFGEVGTIESAKAVLELVSPISGTIVAVNAALEENPGLINEDPYGAGWVAELELTDYAGDAELLIDGAAYAALVQRKAAEDS